MSVKSPWVQKCHWKNSIMATEWFLSWIDWKMCLDNNVQREWLRWQNCYYFRQCDNGWLLLMWPLCSRRCWGRAWSGLGVRCKDWNHFEWSNWTFDDCHSLISQMTIYQFTSRKLTQQKWSFRCTRRTMKPRHCSPFYFITIWGFLMQYLEAIWAVTIVF